MESKKITDNSRKEKKYLSSKEIVKILEDAHIISGYDPKIRAYPLKPILESDLLKHIKGICPYVYTVDPRGKRLAKYYGKELWAYQANTPLVRVPVIHLFKERNHILSKPVRMDTPKNGLIAKLTKSVAVKETPYDYLEIINEG